jgi:hypothetical protein
MLACLPVMSFAAKADTNPSAAEPAIVSTA